MTREDIENEWLEFGFSSGRPLCEFFRILDYDNLENTWNQIWNKRYLNNDKTCCYIFEYFEDECECYITLNELTYLTRALSLNMLLDDNLC